MALGLRWCATTAGRSGSGTRSSGPARGRRDLGHVRLRRAHRLDALPRAASGSATCWPAPSSSASGLPAAPRPAGHAARSWRLGGAARTVARLPDELALSRPAVPRPLPGSHPRRGSSVGTAGSGGEVRRTRAAAGLPPWAFLAAVLAERRRRAFGDQPPPSRSPYAQQPYVQPYARQPYVQRPCTEQPAAPATRHRPPRRPRNRRPRGIAAR